MAEKITQENALKKLDQQLQCPLCLYTLKEPKHLPCCHIFCKSCLERLVTGDGRSVQCPICRCNSPLPAEGVSGLQSDFHIAHLLEVQKAFSKVDQSSGKKCELCEEHPATGYCHDCEQFSCDNCQIAHNRIKNLKNHKFINLDQLHSDTINFVPPKKAIPRCAKHSNKELEIYCETCHELICYSCTVHIHKDHSYGLVADVFVKHKGEIVSGLRPVRESLDRIQQTLKAFDSRAKEINEQRATVVGDIHKEFDQLQRLLDQQRDRLVGTLDMLTQQKLKSLAAQRDRVVGIQAKLTSCLEIAGLETGTEEEVLAMKYPVLTRIEQINAEFDLDTIQPETMADLLLTTDSKEQLQTTCQQFEEIVINCISHNNSIIDEDTLERVIKVGEQKPVEFHAMTKTNKQFSMNLDLTADLKVRKVSSKVDQCSRKICELCEEHPATGYCHECEQFACDNCQATHNKIKSLKNHIYITIDQLLSDTINFVPPKKAIPRCAKHSNKELEIYCETCHELICNSCIVRLHKDHNYDLVADVFAKHKEEIVSGLRPVRERLDTVQQTLKSFDSRAREINEQRFTVEGDIHKEFDHLQRLLDQRRGQLVSTLDVLTQQKLKSLAAQRDHVEIIQVKLTSCLEYAEGGLKTGTDEEVLAMKYPVLTRIEQINAEFDPDTINPETMADLRLDADGKEQLQTACQQFAEIIINCISPNNSFIRRDTLEGVVIVGQQKSVEFHARTKTNKQFLMNLDITAKLIHTKSKNRLRCEVFKLESGAHKINYQPARRGKNELHVTLDGSHVRGSPCLFNVVPSSQSLIRPVRTMGGLNEPTGTAINSRGQIVVAEGWGHCISILTAEGERITTFGAGGSRNVQLSHPWGVTIDRDDNIYVVDNGNHRVQKFTSDGKFLAKVGSYGSNNLQFTFPSGTCFHNNGNSLYVCDQFNHRIQVLSTDLKFKSSFGTRGGGYGQFQCPHYIAIDNTNNLYVTDTGNHRVQVFTAEGQFLRAFTDKANGEKLKYPFAIAIDSSNTVYVSEDKSHCVSVFTCLGHYITSFGKQGTEEGEFKYVYGLTVDGNDSIIVSDHGNERLQIF